MGWPFVSDARLSGRGDKFRGKLVVVSNREPYVSRETGRGWKLEVPAGGLVSALDTVLRVTGGTWVAWGSGSGNQAGTDDRERLWVPPENPAYTLRRVHLSPQTVKNYYSGFCNQVLWPLLHEERDRVVCKAPFWNDYVSANGVFAAAVLEEADRDSPIWIQDYHLCLVPRLLRKAAPERIIAHFWHVPWPGWETFACAPHGPELIAGLLGNDLIGFQIPSYAENFLECAAACLGAAVDAKAMTVTWRGGVTQVRSFPISTDFQRFDLLAASTAAATQAERIRKRYALPRQVGLAVDRLDYTKGISQRLEALDLFFRQYRDFRGIFTFIQIAVATRKGKPYLRYRQEIEKKIAEINATFGTADWQPILYRRRKLDGEDLAAFYRLADVAVITPLRDGMNLVAKEYVAARCDGDGVLILGQGAGAATELTDALLVDPGDSESFAAALHHALTLPPRERRERMARLRHQVQRHTIYSWIGDILDELALLPVIKKGQRHALRHGEEIAARLEGRNLFLLLDFDGTLAPIVDEPELAEMSAGVRSVLAILKERCPVAVLSGRSLEDLRKRVGLPGILCAGNHGAERDGGEGRSGNRTSLEAFLCEARRTFAALPGVRIEDKGLTASVHFRQVEPVLQGKFLSLFETLARTQGDKVQLSAGRKVFDVRPQGAMDKGESVRQLLEERGKGMFPICLGDDTSDESAFRALRGTGLSVSVGGSLEADYYLRNQGEVLEFLKLIASLPSSGKTGT